MIEINLLSEDIKAKKISPTKTNFILSVATGIIAIFIIFNIYVFLLTTVRRIQFRALSQKWQDLEPDRKRAGEFKEYSQILSQDVKAIKQITANKISWSTNLNKLSLMLPKAVWFNEVALDNKNFIIKGSVISLKKEEMSIINSFLSSLKQDRSFFSGFATMDLSTVERRLLGGIEVVDFTFNGLLKNK